MINRFLFLFTLVTLQLSAGIQDHFHKIEDKTDGHSIRNVDYIYLINLDQRPEKFANCVEELSPWGIEPYRFSAVNGWELSLEAINDCGVKYESWMENNNWGTYYPVDGDGSPQHEVVHVEGRNYFCHCMSRGAVGITLSHLSILQDAYDSGYETIWVMEDDVEVLQNPYLISDRIDELNALVGSNSWDILFTDLDTKNNDGNYVPCSSYAWRPDYKPKYPGRSAFRKKTGKFMRVGARYGAYSYIIRRAGMKKILDYYKAHQAFLPYDMDFCLPNGITFYSMNDIVSHKPGSLSDNGGANYLDKTTSSVKQKAFYVMSQLDGWCTESKAEKMIDLVLETEPDVIVEVGVFGGKSLLPMAVALDEIGKGIAYGIDPWTSTASAEGMDGVNEEWWGSLDHEAIYQRLLGKINQFKLNDRVELIRATSEDAPAIPNIDILHIDGNHSEKAAYFDATKWVPLVKPGGLVIFDDITWGTTSKAVNWFDERCEKVALYRESGFDWGVWRKPLD